MSSLFDERSTYSTQFNFNQVGYNSQRQKMGTTDPSLTRWVVQPKSTSDQKRFNQIVASSLFHPPEVINQLSFGVGQGIGLSMPLPMPGTTATVLNIGNQKYAIGASILAKNSKYVFSKTRAKEHLGVPLPSALKVAVTSAGGYVNAGGFCTVTELTELATTPGSPLTPGSISTTDPLTSIKYKVEPISTKSVINTRNTCSLAPLVNQTTEYLSQQGLASNAKILNQVKSNQLNLIDAVSKQETRQDIETTARARQFKLEILREVQDRVQTAIGAEAGRAASYPVLYKIANSAWGDPILKEAFKQIARIESNPTFLEVSRLTKLVNQYLPAAKQVYNFLFPDRGEPTVSTFGASIDLASSTIVPDYQPQIKKLNGFLPTDLQLSLSLDANLLTLGTFAVTREVSFPFTDEFKSYVSKVNSYLPSDLTWKWGLGEPPKLLIIFNGGAINSNLGLLIADTALDATKIANQQLSCSTTDPNIDLQLVENQISSSSSTEFTASSALQTELFASLPGIFDFTDNKFGIDRKGLLNLQQRVLNTALPPGLQLGLKTDSANNLAQVNLGPLQANRTSVTSWIFQVPNANNLASGIGVLQTIGVIPPDLSYLQNSLLEFTSFYEQNKQTFVDVLGPDNLIDSAISSPLAKFAIDFSKGIKIDQVPSPNPNGYGPSYPEQPSAWSSLEDVKASTISSGFVDSTNLENFTQRPTLGGSFLPLWSYAESQIGASRSNNTSNDAYAKLGRSPSGVSITDGKSASVLGINYSLLPSLCADSGLLIPDAGGEGYSIDIPQTDNPFISGFEYAAENPATPLQIVVIDEIDPQSNRDALEVQLIESGLGELASRALDKLDIALWPPRTAFDTIDADNDEFDYLIPGQDYVQSSETIEYLVKELNDRTEAQLEPIPTDINLSVIDLLELVQTIGELPTQQVIGGLLVATTPSTPEIEVAKIGTVRIQERLDCQSLSYFQSVLDPIKKPEDFIDYAVKYGVLDAQPGYKYLLDPLKIVDLVKQTEPRLVPAIEYLLKGDLAGFFQQLIWAKTGADIFNSPLSYLALQTNVRSYYGQAVPSSNPADEWLKEYSK